MKRRVKRNVYGNLYGYEGNRKVEIFNGRGIDPFSEQEEKASQAWLSGNDDWYTAVWED